MNYNFIDAKADEEMNYSKVQFLIDWFIDYWFIFCELLLHAPAIVRV